LAESFAPAGMSVVRVCRGLTVAEAEAFLDWLEGNGCPSHELLLEDGGFAILYQDPPPNSQNSPIISPPPIVDSAR
jgi:hypothetical protein